MKTVCTLSKRKLKVDHNQEERIRALEDEQHISITEKNYQRDIDDRNRRKRTELISWLALVISIASIVINGVVLLT